MHVNGVYVNGGLYMSRVSRECVSQNRGLVFFCFLKKKVGFGFSEPAKLYLIWLAIDSNHGIRCFREWERGLPTFDLFPTYHMVGTVVGGGASHSLNLFPWRFLQERRGAWLIMSKGCFYQTANPNAGKQECLKLANVNQISPAQTYKLVS